jgi:hypothetical protein
MESTDLMVSINQNAASPTHGQTFTSSTPPTGRINALTVNWPAEFCLELRISVLVQYFCSEVRLASARLPQNLKIKIFFLEASMSNHSKDRSPLCSFMFVV